MGWWLKALCFFFLTPVWCCTYSSLTSDRRCKIPTWKYLLYVFSHHKYKNGKLSSKPQVTSPAASHFLLSCIWSHFKAFLQSLSCNMNAAGGRSGLHTAPDLLLWKPLTGIVNTTMVWLTALNKASHRFLSQSDPRYCISPSLPERRLWEVMMKRMITHIEPQWFFPSCHHDTHISKHLLPTCLRSFTSAFSLKKRKEKIKLHWY